MHRTQGMAHNFSGLVESVVVKWCGLPSPTSGRLGQKTCTAGRQVNSSHATPLLNAVAMDTSVCSFGYYCSSKSGLGALRPPGRSQQVTIGKQVLRSSTEKAKRGGAWARQSLCTLGCVRRGGGAQASRNCSLRLRRTS